LLVLVALWRDQHQVNEPYKILLNHKHHKKSLSKNQRQSFQSAVKISCQFFGSVFILVDIFLSKNINLKIC